MLTSWVQAIGGLLAALAAVLAWAAKIKWSTEYAAAKEETISAKQAHIERLESEVELLRHQDPVRLREHYLSIKSQHEEVIEELRREMSQTQEELRRAQATGQKQEAAEAEAVAALQVRWLERFREAVDDTRTDSENKLPFMVAVDPSVAALQLEVTSASIGHYPLVVFYYLGILTQASADESPESEQQAAEVLVAAVQRRIRGQLQHVEPWVFRSHLRRQVAARHRSTQQLEARKPDLAGQGALAARHFETAWNAVYEAARSELPWPERIADELFTEATAAQHRTSWRRAFHPQPSLYWDEDELDPLNLSRSAAHWG